MAKELSLTLGPPRKSGAGAAVYVLLLFCLMGLGLLAWLAEWKWSPRFHARIDGLMREVKHEQAARLRVEGELSQLTKRFEALLRVSQVELLFKVEGKVLPRTAVRLPYTRQGSVLVHSSPSKALYFVVGEHETLGDVAAHAGTLGAWYLWPALAEENALAVAGEEEISRGTILRIPSRLGDWQVRKAITAAGAPDAVRDEIFRQAQIVLGNESRGGSTVRAFPPPAASAPTVASP